MYLFCTFCELPVRGGKLEGIEWSKGEKPRVMKETGKG